MFFSLKKHTSREVKYLIAGLGNIGFEYSNTRHNIGFDILDHWASVENIKFEEEKRAFVGRHRYKGKPVILIKPTTFMNLSGKAINYWMQKEKIPIENLLIIVDDIALPVGKLRLKASGSNGGHNGLGSINNILGRSDYVRLRFGIGNDFSTGKQSDYVLSPWENDEIPLIKEKTETSVDIIKSFISIGVQRTMNYYNNKT